MKVLHIITGLGNGGAEAALMRLVRSDQKNLHIVYSLTGLGRYGTELRSMGIQVECSDMPRGRLTLRGLLHLFRFVKAVGCDVVQTWMYHSDLVGGLAARFARKPVVWGVRHSRLDFRTSLSTRCVAFLCGLLSRYVPAKIVFCSDDAARGHEAYRYAPEKAVVVPNGFDWKLLKPDIESRARLRLAWGLADDVLVLGMVARWHEHKDHRTLLAALEVFGGIYRGSWICMLVGPGMSEQNKSLRKLIPKGIERNVRLLGESMDIAMVMNAIDIHVLSSVNEAFPNVLVEALACGTRVVATTVGDAPKIVGDCGWLVPPTMPGELAKSIGAAAVVERADLQTIARRGIERVHRLYGVEAMACRYAEIWNAAIAAVCAGKTSRMAS